MANIKQFDLIGIGSDVQFGKGGTKINSAAGAFNMFGANDTTLVNVRVATPLLDTDAATKLYVDTAIQGLDIKEEVQAATTVLGGDLGATYAVVGGGLDTLTFGAATLTIDTHAVVNGDRVLVKNQTDAKQNGIYVASGVGTAVVLTRTADAHTGALLTNAFVFVAGGAQYGTGWTMTTPSPVVLDTSNIIWSQFSGAGSYTAGAGISLISGAFSANVDNVTTAIMSNKIVVAGGTTGQTLVAVTGAEAAWGAISLTAGSNAITGTLGVVNGGTGASTLTDHAVLVGSGTAAITALGLGTAGQALLSGGAGADPAFGALDISTAAITGVLNLAHGGTNNNLTAVAGAVAYSDASGILLSAAGTAGQVLKSNGTAAPSFANLSSLAVVQVQNVGSAPGQIYRDEVAGVVSLRTLDVGSNKLSINTNTPNVDEIYFDVVEANLTLNNIGGTLSTAKGGTGQDFSTLAANNLIYTGATGTFAALPISTYFQGLLTDSSMLAVQTSLALVPGTNIQAYNANLTSIASLAGTGLVVQTASNTFVERQVLADTAAAKQGIIVANPAGAAGNITVGLDIVGLAGVSPVTNSMALPAYDGANNVKITIADIAAKVALDNPVDPMFAYGSVGFAASTNVGTVLPANTRVLRIMVNVTNAYNVGANMEVKDASNNVLAGNADIDLQTAGIYKVDLMGTDFTSAGQAIAAITSGTSGAATISIDYKIAA